ncbi:hypothetical protein L7F22_013144 [Adiantum nelumboides]|nr:hypothetical protein [Adiantum nelumboides]
MFSEVMQNPRFLAFLQPPLPPQQVGSQEQMSEPVRAQAQVMHTTNTMETPVRLSESMQTPKPMPIVQGQVAEMPVSQALPVQPATFQVSAAKCCKQICRNLLESLLMDISALLTPANSKIFVSSSSQHGCAKLLLSCGGLSARQHKILIRHPIPSVAQPSKPPSLSLQVYSLTWEGDTVTDKCFEETVLKYEVGEAHGTFQTVNDKVELNTEATNNSHTRRIGGIYAPWKSKDIRVPLDALKTRAILTGKVTKLVRFGAFVDVGAILDGLIHVSNISNKHLGSVEDIKDIIKEGDEVKVQVLYVDVPSRRLSFKLIKEVEDLKTSSGHSNPSITSPCKPLPLSLKTNAAVGEGGMGTDNCFTETVLQHEVGEAYETRETKDERVERSFEASEKRYTRQIGGNDAPWSRKVITVPLDALKAGAILTGKVTNIVQFGAFVDVGAFSSGLIHISKITDKRYGSIEDVKDIVKVGDKVKVQVVSVDVPSKRIVFNLVKEDGDLMVKKQDDFQQHKQTTVQIRHKSSPTVAGKPQKGELVTGSIEKIVPRGVIVTLKQGHAGFLPASEVLSSGTSVDTTSYFKVGQQLTVRVLRTTRSQITLTMRKREKIDRSQETMVISGEAEARSPFEVAFWRDKIFAKFLEDRERLRNLSKDEEDGSVMGSATEVQQS